MEGGEVMAWWEQTGLHPLDIFLGLVLKQKADGVRTGGWSGWTRQTGNPESWKAGPRVRIHPHACLTAAFSLTAASCLPLGRHLPTTPTPFCPPSLTSLFALPLALIHAGCLGTCLPTNPGMCAHCPSPSK